MWINTPEQQKNVTKLSSILNTFCITHISRNQISHVKMKIAGLNFICKCLQFLKKKRVKIFWYSFKIATTKWSILWQLKDFKNFSKP